MKNVEAVGNKARLILLNLGVEPKPVPLKVIQPLLEAASLEEEPDIQELWARLLATASTRAGVAGPRASSRRDSRGVCVGVLAEPVMRDRCATAPKFRPLMPSTTSFNLRRKCFGGTAWAYNKISMRTMINRLLLVFVLCSMAAQAATISYSGSGTFSAATPTTPFSGPSEPWAFSFQADSNPAVSDVTTGTFDFAFSNFSYSLNNSPVAITPIFIRFGSSPNGGWLMSFNGTTTNPLAGLSTLGAGPQMFAGTTSAPTLIPGAFTSTEFDVFLNRTSLFTQPNTTVNAVAVATPEPSTWLTLAVGLVVLGGRRVFRRT